MTQSVTEITPHLRDLECPDVLRALPAWLTWRMEHVDGEAKGRKIPYYADGAKRRGVQGSPEDRQHLVTFDAAKAAAMRRGMTGVGFALMPEFNVCALDFDNCVGPDGVHPDVLRLVAGTYAEFSPSGNGVRAFVRGALGNRKDAHGTPFGLEVFSEKGFVTYTANPLPLTLLADATNTIADASPEVLAYCAQRFGREAPSGPVTPSDTRRLGLAPAALKEALDVLDPSMPHEPWFAIGQALHHETGGEGFHLWDEWSSRGAQYPGSAVLRGRWDSLGNGANPVTAYYLVRLANSAGAHIDVAALESADDFEVVGAAAPAKPARFTPVPIDEFVKRPSPSWIVKGVIPRAALIVLYGESGSGKSFIALDIAAAIARGVEWRGRRVRQGRVVYIAAEGAGGFRNRCVAYLVDHDAPAGLPIDVIPERPNLLMGDDALDLARAIGPASVVIIDTFAQVMPGGNENAGEDMGKALAHCDGIHRATGAVVLLVHHSGKDAARGARGWSGLKAAADAELEVVKTPGGRMLRTTKQKDGDDTGAWGFDLQVVQIGQDEDGDTITSCVVREAELPAIQQVGEAARRMGPVETVVNAVLQEMAQVQTSGIEVKAVIAEAARRLPEPQDGKRDRRKEHAKRALESLCDGDSAPYWITDNCIEVM